MNWASTCWTPETMPGRSGYSAGPWNSIPYERAISYQPDVHQYLGAIYSEQGNIDLYRQEMALYDRLRHKTSAHPH